MAAGGADKALDDQSVRSSMNQVPSGQNGEFGDVARRIST
jgi:hypothetical protein